MKNFSMYDLANLSDDHRIFFSIVFSNCYTKEWKKVKDLSVVDGMVSIVWRNK